MIHKIVTQLPNKFCIGDIIPTALFKKCLDNFMPFIVDICNSSFQTGLFPKRLKTSFVTPVLKKKMSNDMSNYRPISSLPLMSKILEKLACTQLINHIENNLPKVYNAYQSAYKKYHSTETLLFHLKDKLMGYLDDEQLVCLVQLDLSSAFDLVHHDTLIQRISTTWNIDGKVKNWLTTYLTNRFQIIVHNGEQSSAQFIGHGVPQGSVLGPFLFTQFIVPVIEIIQSEGISCHIYADDIQMYIPCRVGQEKICACKEFHMNNA